jgi:hypothetical protein
MTNTTYLKQPISCNECSFTTTDVALFNNHSCDIAANGGRCEDFPCCGHEAGDCNGLLYGSDEAIKSDPHLLCDHNTGGCEVEYDEPEDDDTYDEQPFTGSEY